jgi:hypothetical protein
MADDKWISVADAADFIGTPDAARLINLAWKSRTYRLRGVRPGESEPVEIPLNERGRIDCVTSRVVVGRLLTAYHSVTMKWADVKRLTQADVRRLTQEARGAAASATPPPNEAPQAASNADIFEAEAGPLVRALALELRRLFPKGRPALRNGELMERVEKEAGDQLGVFSPRTLERAIALAWPRAKRQRALKAGEACQN